MSNLRNLILYAALIFIGFAVPDVSGDAEDFDFVYDNPDDGQSEVDPLEIIDMSVQIDNLVNGQLSFELNILNGDDLENSGINVWWSNNGQDELTSKSYTITKIDVPGESSQPGITVSIEASDNAVYGSYQVELKCKDKNSPDFEEISLSFDVNEKAAVSVQLTEGSESTGSVDVNNETQYEIQINNDGNKENTFELSFSQNDWDAEFEVSEVTIDAFTSEIVILTITTDDRVYYEDEDTITVKAADKDSPATVKDTISLTTIVRVKYGLEFSIANPSLSGEPGSTVSFNFKLLNKWSDNVNYEISKKDWYRGTVGNRPEGWTEGPGSGTLSRFQETNGAKFSIDISSGANAGEVVTIIVEATSSDDLGKGEPVTLEVEVRVEGNYNLRLLVDDATLELPAEQSVSISQYVKVKNLAKVTDLVYVTAEWELGGNDWDLILPDPISLSANEEKSLFINVKAPESDAGGQATLKVKVTSGGDSNVLDEKNIVFQVNTAQEASGPETEALGEESDFPVDPIWLVSIVLIIGLGSAAVFSLNQKAKGGFGGKNNENEDYSDEWAGMEGGAMPPMNQPPAAAPPQPPAAAPPQPPAATPPQPEVPPAAPTILTITVPDGVMAGQQIQIKAPSGQLVNVKVPEGCGPGSQFKIQI